MGTLRHQSASMGSETYSLLLGEGAVKHTATWQAEWALWLVKAAAIVPFLTDSHFHLSISCTSLRSALNHTTPVSKFTVSTGHEEGGRETFKTILTAAQS